MALKSLSFLVTLSESLLQYTEARVTKSEIIASEFSDFTRIFPNYLHYVLRIMDDKEIKKIIMS